MTVSAESTEYNVNIGEGASGIVIGDNATYIQQSQEQPFIDESPDELIADLFVDPSGADALIHILQNRHLLILYGEKRMGKATIARYVARNLQQSLASHKMARMKRYSDLQDMIDALETERQMIIRAEDVDPAEIEDAADVIREVALKGGHYVILTAVSMTTDWILALECRECAVEVKAGFPYSDEDLLNLIELRLSAFLSGLKRNGVSPRSLFRDLNSPSKITYFAEVLSSRDALPDADEIQDIIKGVQNTQLEVERWLHTLSNDERYLILVLALFDDLPAKLFWRLYDQMLDSVRKKGFPVLPLDYYALEFARRFVSVDEHIAFLDQDYRHATLLVLLRQYRRSLLAFLPYLEKVPASASASDRDFRIAVAQAVGYVSDVEWEECELVFREWMKSSAFHVRACTSHAFCSMLGFAGTQGLQGILEILDNWYDSSLPHSRGEDTSELANVRWTVASSIGRIGHIVPKLRFREDVLPRLDRVSRDENYSVRCSAVYALHGLVLSRFDDIRYLLTARAADWHVDVRAEVVQVVHLLYKTRPQLVSVLVEDWLEDGRIERFWTVLQMYSFFPETGKMLYGATDRDSKFSSEVQDYLIDILEESREPIAQISPLFGALVRDNVPTDSYFVIRPLVRGCDYQWPTAAKIVDIWLAQGVGKFYDVAAKVRDELISLARYREGRERILLQNHLYDEEILLAYIITLPPAKAAVFRQTVERRRQEERQRRLMEERAKSEKQSRDKRLIITVIIIVVILSVLMCCCNLFGVDIWDSAWNDHYLFVRTYV
jgi:hypothetical protein